MLKKLIKYDLKATRSILLVYIIAAALTLFWSIIFAFADFENIFITIIITMFAAPTLFVGVAVMLMPLIMITIRFYKHLISNEAYLTFTLPVPRYYHIISKTITYAIWFVFSTIVLVLCLFAVIFTFIVARDIPIAELLDSISKFIFGMEMILDQISNYTVPIIVECSILYVVSLVKTPLFMFASLSFGQVLIKKIKILGAFVAYMILNGISSGINSVVSFIVEIVTAFSMSDINGVADVVVYYLRTGAFLGIIDVIWVVVLYIFTHRCLTKKLNLE